MTIDYRTDVLAAHTLALRINEDRKLLDCGHWSMPTYTLVPNWRDFADTPGQGAAGWNGYGTDPGTGRTMCPLHIREAERIRMQDAWANRTTFVAYTSSDGRLITTWPGGELAKVVHSGVSNSGWNGSEIHTWRAVDPDGHTWYGRNGGNGMAITLRPAKH